MNKTIEEAIKVGWNICDKAADMGSFDFYNTGFLNGVAHLRSLPLASRLTADEKERVKVIYNEELGMAQHFHAKAKASNDISCRQHYYGLREPYISRMKLLERIFGADFFKEGE